MSSSLPVTSISALATSTRWRCQCLMARLRGHWGKSAFVCSTKQRLYTLCICSPPHILYFAGPLSFCKIFEPGNVSACPCTVIYQEDCGPEKASEYNCNANREEQQAPLCAGEVGAVCVGYRRQGRTWLWCCPRPEAGGLQVMLCSAGWCSSALFLTVSFFLLFCFAGLQSWWGPSIIPVSQDQERTSGAQLEGIASWPYCLAKSLSAGKVNIWQRLRDLKGWWCLS